MNKKIGIKYPEKEFCKEVGCETINRIENLEQTLKLNSQSDTSTIFTRINLERESCNECYTTKYLRYKQG